MAAKSQKFLKEALKDEPVIKNSFQQIVGIIMEKDDSLPIPSRVLANPVDRISPIFDQLYNVCSQFPKMRDQLKDYFQFVFPALADLLIAIIFLILFLIPFLLVLYDFLLLHSPFRPQILQTLLNIEIRDRCNFSPQVRQAYLPCLYSLLNHNIGIFFPSHMLQFGQE